MEPSPTGAVKRGSAITVSFTNLAPAARGRAGVYKVESGLLVTGENWKWC